MQLQIWSQYISFPKQMGHPVHLIHELISQIFLKEIFISIENDVTNHLQITFLMDELRVYPGEREGSGGADLRPDEHERRRCNLSTGLEDKINVIRNKFVFLRYDLRHSKLSAGACHQELSKLFQNSCQTSFCLHIRFSNVEFICAGTATAESGSRHPLSYMRAG